VTDFVTAVLVNCAARIHVEVVKGRNPAILEGLYIRGGPETRDFQASGMDGPVLKTEEGGPSAALLHAL